MLQLCGYRCTVAGTVYDFHVIPYSPAFKPAPATTKEQLWLLKYYFFLKKANRLSPQCAVGFGMHPAILLQ